MPFPDQHIGEEFAIYLETIFPAAFQVDKNVIKRGLFKLHYDKYRFISKLEYEGKEENLDQTLLDFNHFRNQKVAREEDFILFSQLPLKGCFESEHFVLFPITEPNVTPKNFFGDWPFAVRVKFEGSPIEALNTHRIRFIQYEIRFLLNALIRDSLKFYPEFDRQEWTLSFPEIGKPIPEYRRIGYSLIEEPSIPQIGEVPLVPYEDYYNQIGLRLEEWEFKLPSNFLDLVNAYYALSSGNKERFIRASYWVNIAHFVYLNSRSLYYQSLVNALESLVPPEVVEQNCSECGKKFYSSRSSDIRKMLKENANWLTNKEFSEIWSIRSKIAHGARLQPSDEAPGYFRFDPVSNSSRREEWKLSRILKIILVNWLMNNSKNSLA